MQGVILVTVARNNYNEQVLDYVYIFHLCPVNRWFIEFINTNDGHVQMENDMSYQIKWNEKLNILLENNHTLEFIKTRYVIDIEKFNISMEVR